MEELEIIRHRRIDGISLFFDTVDYRTPHFHPEWELIWITEGALSIRLGPEGCVGTAGDLFLFHPGKLHEFCCVRPGATFLCLQISPPVFDKVCPGFGRLVTGDYRVNPYFDGESCAALRRELLEMARDYLERPPLFELRCTGRGALLLARLLSELPCHTMSAEEQASTKMKNARLARFIRFVDENYARKIRLADFAAAEGCSVSYLSRFLKASLNQTFQDYVNAVRFRSACKLMAGGGMKMLDICEEAGFSDYRYFSAAFRKQSGMTPEEHSRQVSVPDETVRYNLHSRERFYTGEQSLLLLEKLRPD